ncbi:hypothetical protein SAMN05421684_6705 [Asanoa ishikariensis]|uniref:Uncharacterized protein n=1 Tax=Asanoa ishikariensis TaxID=137265 RepID=A0A1H3U7F7_9ACTN|nr:hypothetical protein [Asanoa ishikariensis]SDZ58396.1 hypothetical protein SAMN05421684_6705 [Asanoa ishikariensis]
MGGTVLGGQDRPPPQRWGWDDKRAFGRALATQAGGKAAEPEANAQERATDTEKSAEAE